MAKKSSAKSKAKSSKSTAEAGSKKVAKKLAKTVAVKKKAIRNPANKAAATPKKQKLAVIKTAENNASVEGFIKKAGDAQKVKDSFALIDMMKKVSGEEPKMWGTAIVGFGKRIYTSPATGRAVEWMKLGFSPRKANLTIYLLNMAEHTAALKKLGKHKVGGGCLYINKLADVDTKVLQGMIEAAYKKNK
jgi:hypothetical protein